MRAQQGTDNVVISWTVYICSGDIIIKNYINKVNQTAVIDKNQTTRKYTNGGKKKLFGLD